MINIKHFDTNNIKIDEKSYKYILIYCIGYVTSKIRAVFHENNIHKFSKMNVFITYKNGE